MRLRRLSSSILQALRASIALACCASACGIDATGDEELTPDGSTPPLHDASALDATNPPPQDANGGGDAGGLDGSKPPKKDAAVDANVADVAIDAPIDAPIDVGVDAPFDAGVENCTNGVDDNGDGKIDCADPECTPGYECVPAAPAGWTGYFRVDESAAPNTAIAPCPDGTQPTRAYEGAAGPAQCTACTCGALTGASCSPPAIECFPGQNDCSQGGGDWTPALKDGMCDKPMMLLGMNAKLSCELSGPATVGNAGSCASSTSTFSNTTPFANELDVCGGPTMGGGCSAGNVCVPKTAPPYAASICIRKDGAQSCPAGFTMLHDTFTGANDTRGCSGCTCSAAATQCTGGDYTFYDLDMCMGDGTGGTDRPVVVSGSTCMDMSNLLDGMSWSAQATLPAPTGSCTPNGGMPTGAVMGMGEKTVCCQ